jgi:heme-degrading monooxygenase HmoA
VERARGAGAFDITVSYWETPQAISNWEANADYQLRVAKVERAYGKSQ